MEKEKMILTHGEVPGYRRVFYIVLYLAVLYLVAIFLMGGAH